MKPPAYHLRPLARSFARPSTVLTFLAPLGLIGYLWYRRGPALDELSGATAAAYAFLAFAVWLCTAPIARFFPGRLAARIPPITRMLLLALALFCLLIFQAGFQSDRAIPPFFWGPASILLIPLFFSKDNCPSCKRVFALRRIAAHGELVLEYQTEEGGVQTSPSVIRTAFNGCAYCGAKSEDRYLDRFTPAILIWWKKQMTSIWIRTWADAAAKNKEIAAAQNPAEKKAKEKEQRKIVMTGIAKASAMFAPIVLYVAYVYCKRRLTALMPRR